MTAEQNAQYPNLAEAIRAHKNPALVSVELEQLLEQFLEEQKESIRQMLIDEDLEIIAEKI